MPANVALFALLLLATKTKEASSDDSTKPPPKVTRVEMSTEEGYRIYQHWVTQALTALMSAFLQAKMDTDELAKELPAPFASCYLHSTTVPTMANCVSRLLKNQFAQKQPAGIGRKDRLHKYQKVGPNNGDLWVGQFQVEKAAKRRRGEAKSVNHKRKKAKASHRLSKLRKKQFPQHQNSLEMHWRHRRGTSAITSPEEIYGIENVAKQGYSLIDPRKSYGLSPIGGLARLLKANVLGRANKTEAKRWQQTMAEIQELRRAKEELDPAEMMPMPKPQRQRNGERLATLRKLLGRDEPIKREKSIDEQIAGLVRDGIKIGMRLAKQRNDTIQGETGSTEVEEQQEGMVDVLSPRFLSITERKSNEKLQASGKMFSPSLFSLHNRGQGLERELSLPKLMKDSRFTGRDQQEWLDLIMEASGVNQQVENLREILPIGEKERHSTATFAERIEKRYKREFDGLYLTKKNVRDMFGIAEERKIDTWAELDRRFTEEQRKEMNRIGYSMLTPDQLKFLYGPKSPFNDSEALARLLPLLEANNSSTTIDKLIEADIHRLGAMRSFDIRQNDVVLSPSLFNPAILNPRRTSQPIILSPVVFSPTILSPTIFGPAILTPRVFSPTILSPRVMTPLIFAPFIFSSIILSPIVMQPFILSPGLINSVILSPFVMNPMVMSSQIMHPFILSPLVMTPGILNPSAMSPYVLSPFVMNPQVFSPKAISGLFLSPYALSPVLQSPVYAYLVILSPSFLS